MENYTSPSFILSVIGIGYSMFSLLITNIALPIWMLVSCLKNKNITVTKRLGWCAIIIIFCICAISWHNFYRTFFATLGATAYGLWGSKNRLHKILAIINIANIIVYTISILGMSFLNNKFSIEKTATLQIKFSSIAEDVLSTSNKELVTNALNVLKDEIKQKSPLNIFNFKYKPRKIHGISLVALLNIYFTDENLTNDEAQKWLNYFERRQNLTQEELDEEIHRLVNNSKTSIAN